MPCPYGHYLYPTLKVTPMSNINEITCRLHCKKAFKVDEAGYADILKQVRDHRFQEELNERLEIAENDKQTAIQLAEEKVKNEIARELAKKDQELADLKAQSKVQLMEELAKRDAEINEMKAKILNAETERKLSVTEAIKAIEKERDALANDVKNKEVEKQLLEKSLNEKFASELKTKDDIIKMKDEEIALRKDMKMKLSTKMVGETLEQHCESEFNKLRATAFQRAEFEKDNDARSGE